MASRLSDLIPLNIDLRDARTAALATVSSFAALSAAWVLVDYNQWVSFGSGGTPPTPAGYWKMTKLRWRMFWSSDNLRDPSPLSNDGRKYLSSNLPQREGERPRIVARTMPQRQQPQSLDPDTSEKLHSIPKKYCDQYPQFLSLDLSKTEGRSTDAIYAKPDLPGRDASAKDGMLGNEIAHVHPADNSLHVWVSPPDAKLVVDRGWGERFPMSSLGMLHPSWIMVYAPRNEEEVEVIEEIVCAGIAYLTGEKIVKGVNPLSLT